MGRDFWKVCSRGAAGAVTGAFVGSGAGVIAAVGTNAALLNAGADIAIDGAAGKSTPTLGQVSSKLVLSGAMGATGVKPFKSGTTQAILGNVATNAALDMATPPAISAVQGIGDGIEPGTGTPSEQFEDFTNPLPDIGGSGEDWRDQ